MMLKDLCNAKNCPFCGTLLQWIDVDGLGSMAGDCSICGQGTLHAEEDRHGKRLPTITMVVHPFVVRWFLGHNGEIYHIWQRNERKSERLKTKPFDRPLHDRQATVDKLDKLLRTYKAFQ